MCGLAWDATPRAVEDLEGGVGEDSRAAACDFHAMGDHGEQLVARLGSQCLGGEDAVAKRLVVLKIEARPKRREAAQPHGQQGLAVEGEVEEAREVDEEVVAQMLDLIEDQARPRAAARFR